MLDNNIVVEMTLLETLLKKYYMQKPEIYSKIFTSDELVGYLTWLAVNHERTYSSEQIEKEVPRISNDSGIAYMGKRFFDDPADTTALSGIFNSYAAQAEAQHIAPQHDITVGRSIRYMPAHWHSNAYFSIYYALSGNCPIHFENEVVTVSPGCVLIVAPSTVHAVPCYADDRVLNLYYVRSSTFDKVFWSLLSSKNLISTFFYQALHNQSGTSYLCFDTHSDPQIRDLMEQMYAEYVTDINYAPQMINMMMGQFFIVLLRKYEGTVQLPKKGSMQWKREFSAMLAKIQTNYNTITLEQIASDFNYSTRQVSRIVQNCTGKNFSQLIYEIRMEKATQMLKNRSMPIQTIASSVGYSTVSSFYRAFQNCYHCTPAEYILSIDCAHNQ